MIRILSILGYISSILAFVSVVITVYSLTIESYSKRNSSIYLQARVLNEQVIDIRFSSMTNRHTIDLIEVYKLDSLLMEKPFITNLPLLSYKESEEYYKQVSNELKKLIQKNNEEILKKRQENVDLNKDNKDSLNIKLSLQDLTDKLIKHTEKFK